MSRQLKHNRKKKSYNPGKTGYSARYFNKIRYFFALYGAEELFAFVPHSYLMHMFQLHLSPPRISVVGRLPQGFNSLMELKSDIYSVMHQQQIKYNNESWQISVYDAATIGIQLYELLNDTGDPFPGFDLIKKKLNSLIPVLSWQNLENNLLFFEIILNNLFSSSDYAYYRTETSTCITASGVPCLKFVLHECHPAATINVSIDRKARPVFELGSWYREFKPFCLTSKQLHIATTIPGEYPVYIQQHALNRLKERVQLLPAILGVHLRLSLERPEVYYRRKNIFLISYRLNEHKVGYLETDLVKDKLIIRTFLLSSQYGTPESMQLEAATGLRSLDVNYLNMTCLSAFAESDIESHIQLAELLDGCGLMPLFQAANLYFHPNGKRKSLAENIENYLKLPRSPIAGDGIV